MGNLDLSKIGEYVSPFQDHAATVHYSWQCDRDECGHYWWDYWRARYAKSGNRLHLDEMLKYVSDEVPPDAPRPIRPAPRRENLGTLLIILGCTGVLGAIVVTSFIGAWALIPGLFFAFMSWLGNRWVG